MSVMPNIPASYRPNESPETIFAEHAWFQGSSLCAVAYGIQFVLYIMTCSSLWKRRARYDCLLIVYISAIFVLSTLIIAGVLQYAQTSFIDGRNIPGGPTTFQRTMFSLPETMISNVSMVISAWFCDIIYLWRCWVVYKRSFIVIIVPGLLYLGTVAFGILLLRQDGTVGQSPWTSSGANFTVPYYALSLALNIIITILIVLRLLVHRYRNVQALGKNQGSPYTSYATMIIESAAIYSLFSLLFLIPFARHNDLANLFIQDIATVQGIATFLIIFRIANGKGFSSDTPNSNRQRSGPSRAIHTVNGTMHQRATTMGPTLTNDFYLESRSYDTTTVVGTLSSGGELEQPSASPRMAEIKDCA